MSWRQMMSGIVLVAALSVLALPARAAETGGSSWLDWPQQLLSWATDLVTPSVQESSSAEPADGEADAALSIEPNG